VSRELLKAVKAIVLCLAVPGAMSVSTIGAQTVDVEAQTAGEPDTSSSAGSFWIPYFTYPEEGTKGGKSGLFLIASNEITSSPAPKWITTSPVQIVGTAYVYGSTVSDFKPGLLMYTSAGSNGETHIYGLNLSDTSSAPTPVQISNFSLTSATGQICGSVFAQTSLRDPTSLFVVLGIGTPGATGCIAPTVQKVVRFTDSSTTAPEVTSLPTYNFTALYDDGVFKGGFGFNLLTEQAYLYNAQLQSRPLASGGLPFPVELGNLNDGTEFGEEVLYFEMLKLTGGSSTLYRIDSKSLTQSTVANLTSTSLGPLPAIADDKNMYYITTSSTTSSFYQVPVSGGAPMLLYTGAVGANSTYQWIGATGSKLIFQHVTIPVVDGNEDEAEATSSVYTIPVGAHSASATRIGGPYQGLVTGFWDEASLTAKPNVYLSITHPLSMAKNATYKFSSVKIPLGGPYNQSPVANSAYGGALVINSVPTIWEVTGINDTRGWGGGTIDLVNLATETSTKLTTTGGKNFTVPDGHLGLLVDLIDDNVAFGDFYPIASVPPLVGAAVDLTHHFICTVSMTNTNVSIY
jgi:hypothetical protein